MKGQCVTAILVTMVARAFGHVINHVTRRSSVCVRMADMAFSANSVSEVWDIIFRVFLCKIIRKNFYNWQIKAVGDEKF